MKRIRGTWLGNLMGLLVCAAFFAVFALLSQMGGIPEYDELERVSGVFSGIEHRVRSRAMGADSEWWEIALADGSVFSANDVIGFDAEEFMECVQPGDRVTVLTALERDGWNPPYEIKRDGEVIHSYETSVDGMKENQKTAWILPLIPLLGACLTWPLKMMRRRRKLERK